MRILIPILGFGAAGGNRVLSELANYWGVAGHYVDFLVDQRSARPYFPTRAGIIRFGKGGRILPQSAISDEERFSASGNGLSIYTRMLRALQRVGRGYDVILANHSLTAIPVALARTGAARKVYYIQAYEPEYYSLEPGLRAKVLERVSALSYVLPLRQVVNSPLYLGYRNIRATVWVPPGVDSSVFFRRPQPPSFAPSRPWTVGVIGRREPTKGTRYALEAFERLAALDSRVHLKVAFGNLPDGWRHDRAEIVVPTNDAELAEFYRSVDVLVAPGTVQLGACHYPVLEAMAVGTPVVTTGYLPASEENAWIVPVHDSDAIVAALREIAAMPESQLQVRLEKASVAIAAFFWESVAKHFLDALSARP